MRDYCSLCDIAYLPKLLALHESLLKHSSEPFTLWFLAMDQQTAKIVDELKLENVRLLPLADFETDMDMAPVRASRTTTEYFWTCASILCAYLMMKFRLRMLTYLDADILFFSDPRIVFEEIGDCSIAIVPHRFAKEDEARLLPNGKFNVSWVSFRHDEHGLACLRKWARQCWDWCYNRNEDGKFGDQGFLDSWPSNYGAAVHIIGSIGVNTAPWNLQQYRVSAGPAVNGTPIVLHHFHEYRNENDLTLWPLREEDVVNIYVPYMCSLRLQKVRIEEAEARIRARNDSAEKEWHRA